MTVVDALEVHKQRRIDALTQECRARITTNFEHSALGSPHVYPADETSQRNGLMSAAGALNGDVTKLLCEGLDSDGVRRWRMRAHTAEQAKAVGSYFRERTEAIRDAKQEARLAVEAATTRAEVDAVTPAWPEAA